MIAYLRGTVAHKPPVAPKGNWFVLDVNGVGYRIHTIAKVLQTLTLKAPVLVHTHAVIREDSHDLYGFTDPAQADFFKLLLSVSGVGPKSALQILELASLDDLRQAVATDRAELLVSGAGLSKRLAEAVVLGLQSKLKDILKTAGTDAGRLLGDAEAVEALAQLGFAPAAARAAVSQVAAKGKPGDDVIRDALKVLGQQNGRGR